MQSIFMSMTYPEIWVYEKEVKVGKSGEDKTVINRLYAFPNIQYPFDALKPYLEEFTKKGGKVVATGMKFPIIDKSIQWKRVEMPDFNNTEAIHLIVCDTKTMWFTKEKCDYPDHWLREAENIKNLILNIKKKFKDIPIIVFAFNKDVYWKLNSWIEELKKTDPDAKDILIADSLCFTYFRSALGSGVRLDYPIKFYIGAADTPENAYEEGELLYDIPSDFLRILEMSDTFKNALGRGKCPEGKRPSISFVIGADIDKVRQLFPEKKEIIQAFTQGTIYKLGIYFTWMWFYRRDEIPIDQIPMYLDALRICVYRWKNKGVIQTRAKDIHNYWRQKEGFNLSINDVGKLMKEWKRLLPSYIKTSGRKEDIWIITEKKATGFEI